MPRCGTLAHAERARRKRSKRSWSAQRTSCATRRRSAPASASASSYRRWRRSSASSTGFLGELLGRTNQLENATANLTTQTSTLVTALRNPASRGKWGEMQLRNVVEKAGMLAALRFLRTADRRARRGARPPGHDDQSSRRALRLRRRQGADRCDASGARGARREQRANGSSSSTPARCAITSTRSPGADIIRPKVRRISSSCSSPAKRFSSSACSEDPALIEYALDKGVLVTGPLALISLLRTLRDGMAGATSGRERQAHRDDRAKCSTNAR